MSADYGGPERRRADRTGEILARLESIASKVDDVHEAVFTGNGSEAMIRTVERHETWRKQHDQTHQHLREDAVRAGGTSGATRGGLLGTAAATLLTAFVWLLSILTTGQPPRMGGGPQ